MKKKKLESIVEGQSKFICMNENHMQIQDNALIRKDEEIKISNAACSELRNILEGKEEALRRSRNMVKGLRQNSDSRSIRDMAKDLYELFFERVPQELRKDWKDLTEEYQEYWMARIVQILSGNKFE